MLKKLQKFFIFISIILILLNFFGCTIRYPEPQVARHDVVEKLQNRTQNAPKAMRIIAKIDYVDEINNKRVVGQDLILSDLAPMKMRITISAFDKAISTLVTDGTGFSLMDTTQNLYVTGLATPENIARVLPLFLSAADLHRIITGSYPLDMLSSDALDETNVTWSEAHNGYRMTYPIADGRREHVYQSWPQGDVFLIEIESADGHIEYLYEASDFKEYKTENGVFRFPETLIFHLSAQKTDVRLRVEKRDFDLEFSPAVFQLKPPHGTRIVVLDERNRTPSSDEQPNAEDATHRESNQKKADVLTQGQ